MKLHAYKWHELVPVLSLRLGLGETRVACRVIFMKVKEGDDKVE